MFFFEYSLWYSASFLLNQSERKEGRNKRCYLNYATLKKCIGIKLLSIKGEQENKRIKANKSCKHLLYETEKMTVSKADWFKNFCLFFLCMSWCLLLCLSVVLFLYALFIFFYLVFLRHPHKRNFIVVFFNPYSYLLVSSIQLVNPATVTTQRERKKEKER